ncbi:MAG: CPBP family intramembrane metalloprotease [Phycisphaerae bacterium]|nr:CPBP family intramembrane metalloprotease [Phycisphaerae bacterium]
MPLAYLLVNVAIVLAATSVRYGTQLPDSPGLWAAPPTSWPALAAASAALAVAGAFCARRALKRAAARRALGELLVTFPVFFAYEWLALPAHPDERNWGDWAIPAALIVLCVTFVWRQRRHVGRLGLTGRNFPAATRLLALPTGALILGLIAIGIAMETPVRPTAVAISAVTYPLYGIAQMGLFQFFLVPRLHRLSRSHAQVVVAAAGLFALIHWPNPVAMVATGSGALIWTWVYLRKPNLYAVALSMGLTSAALVHALPDTLTHHMRTGPIYVLRILEAAP